jgi:DNA mismatch repair protein MutS
LLNADLEERLDLAPDLRELLERTLVDDPPIQVREGGVIRTGVHAELDELRDVASGGKQWIASFQKAEAERIGVPSLKVGFNKVFGFYIEISNAHKGKAPPEYQRKQTVKNAERYVTEELKAYEQKVLGAEERSKALEYELFDRLREDVAAQLPRLQGVAAVLAELDVVVALAELASLRNYCRPRVEDSDELTIVGGRHPVLDVSMPPGRFVPNDVRLGGGAGRFLLITGPNMAGKSTYIRQVALIVILAQIGGFTPAESAVVGVADRLFARVGASDELSRGQSTFMVEMTEAANILNNATPRSLVVLDEIGRGTSTYDGVSLAWAVAEHLHDVVKCRTLFATHYHELIELERSLPGLRNLNVAVREWKDEIVFLHQIVEGGADRSYGIHVARLAGVPKSVLRRAQEVLEHLERDPFGESRRFDRPHKRRRTYHQLSLFPSGPEHPVLDEIRALDAASMDPEKLAQLVAEWKEKICRADGA